MSIKYKNIFITGATGFLGSFIVKELIKQNINIKALVRKTSNLKRIKGLNIEIIYGDLDNENSLKEGVKNSDIIIHCAALKRGKKEDFYKSNEKGTRNLIEATKNENIKQFIYISSIAAMGPSDDVPLTEEDECKPISLYGKSKLEGEIILKEAGLPYTILRPPIIYGPYDYDMSWIFKIISLGFRPHLDRKITMMYIDDVVESVLQVIGNEIAINKTYILSQGPYQWSEIVDKIATLLNVKGIKIKVPNYFLIWAGNICEKINSFFCIDIPLNREKAKEGTTNWIFSGEKIKKEIGFTPKWDLENGLKKTIEWYRQNNVL
jgi:nucleoside-diphosphate-sugar epimerase